ncbi:carboxypeptidase regulatory-like domain-containing protein [Exiguobacterium sp. s140]|uniref:carboxypeptidase regulatory-like domain-containing protein n=1 Tax=Exiguobacterium sp. s140 TaxID=2751290 RepID=UPI001BE66217|nr:carboxypeptidase-like regulatory domain-containing protein [Exiguobacterium sp. s140]
MKVNQSKRTKKVALTVLSATMVVSPMTSLAKSESLSPSEQKSMNAKVKGGLEHVVALQDAPLGLVAPNGIVQFSVDQNDHSFKSNRQQLEKQDFAVLLTSESGDKTLHQASYMDGVVSIEKHQDFDRYTAYSATVLVKSDYQKALKGNLPVVNFDEGVVFKTGSGVGEASQLSAELEDVQVSVEEDAILKVEATDDYGNPAIDATIIVEGKGEGNAKVASTLTEPIIEQLEDGKAEVKISEHSANDVSLTYQLVDNAFQDSFIETGSAEVEFTPGKTNSVDVELPDKIVAGEDYTIKGEAEDLYGNSVKDGTSFDVSTDVGVVSNENPTVDGEFMFDYEAPTKTGTGGLTIKGDGFEYTMGDVIVVNSATPEKVVVSLPDTVNAGESVSVSGVVEDAYGNPVPNAKVEVDGALSGTFTTDKNGAFNATLEANSSGDVTATIEGQPVSMTTPNGDALTSVSVVTSTPKQLTMNKPSTMEQGKYYTVSGILLDQDGKPVANQTVTISGAFSGTVTTNANGSYSGQVRANSTGMVYARVGTTNLSIQTPSGQAITTVTINPPAPVVGTVPNKISLGVSGYSSHYIRGKVTDSSGRPVPNAKVFLQKSSYGDYYSYGNLQTAYTNENGEYTFTLRGSYIQVFVMTENKAKSRIVFLEKGVTEPTE